MNGMPLEGEINKEKREMKVQVDDWVFDQRVVDENVQVLLLFAKPTRAFGLEFAPNDDFSREKPQFAGKVIPSVKAEEIFGVEIKQFTFEQAKIANEEAQEAAGRARMIDYTKKPTLPAYAPEEPKEVPEEKAIIETIEGRFSLEYIPKGLSGKPELELVAESAIEIGYFDVVASNHNDELKGKYFSGEKRRIELYERGLNLTEIHLTCNDVNYVFSLVRKSLFTQKPDLKIVRPGKTAEDVRIYEEAAAERKATEAKAIAPVVSQNAKKDEKPEARKWIGDIHISIRSAGEGNSRRVVLDPDLGKAVIEITEFSLNGIPVPGMDGIYIRQQKKSREIESLGLADDKNIIIRFKANGREMKILAGFENGVVDHDNNIGLDILRGDEDWLR